MATRIYLLRHAETANPRVFHGAESNIELSERGQEQAVAVAVELMFLRPECVISSAMHRAVATAEVIAMVCEIPHRIEPHLHERRVGILSRRPFATEGIWPETLRRWKQGETSYAHEGAESFDDVRTRVLPVWERILRDQRNRTIAVVAHGIVCKVLLLTLFPSFVWDSIGPIRNVAVTELVHDDAGWRLIRLDEYPTTLTALDLY